MSMMSGPRPESFCGMSAIVRTLAVTSSPTRPSPRVAALTRKPVFIAQRTRQPVDLGLGGEGEFGRRVEPKKAFYPRDEILHFVVGENIAQRQHRDGMDDLGEFLRRRRADLPAQRFFLGELRKLLFKRLVAAAQGVIVRVGDDRRVLLVIGAVMRGDFLAEFLVAPRRARARSSASSLMLSRRSSSGSPPPRALRR